jgi:hypothetical protein
VAIILVAWIAVSFVVSEWSDIARGEICEKNEYTQKKECATYEVVPFAFIKAGKFLDYHNGLLVAIFTGLLWWVSLGQFKVLSASTAVAEKAADAAMLQAKAAIAAQLPLVPWIGHKLVEYNALGKPTVDPVTPGPVPQIFAAVIGYKNVGPTSIVVRHFAIKCAVHDELPEEPFFGGMSPDNIVVTKDQERWFASQKIELTEDEKTRLANNSATLWAYGFIFYTDFLTDGHQIGTIAKWDAERGFVGVHRENYSYIKDQKTYTGE